VLGADVQTIRAVVTTGVLTAAAVSAAPAAAMSHPTSPASVVDAVKGRTLGPGWTVFVAQMPHKPAVAVETATDGGLGEAYFAFPTAKDAVAFEANPPTLAVAQARGTHPVVYTLAGQDGFTSQKLNSKSTVYTFKGGVGIFLQQGTTIVLGTYLGAPPKHRAGYDLLSLGLSHATQEAATFLTAIPTTSSG